MHPELSSFLPENALVMAPMVEISHRALRTIVHEQGGCDVYYTEMASAAAYMAGAAWDKWFLDTQPCPQRTILQFYFVDRERMVQAAQRARWIEAAGLDLNFGCSAPHIERSGGGVFWMKDAHAAQDVVKAVRDVWPDRFLSAKIRSGYEDDYGYLRDFCSRLAEAGLDWIVLHPRLKSEKFRRSGRWDYVRQLKEDLDIPVIGNGDVRTFEDWQERLKNYKPSGVMIGRAAIRKPWIFALFRGKESNPAFSMEIDLQELAHRVMDGIVNLLPPEYHRSRGRRFFHYFCENFTFSHHVQTKMRHADTIDQMRAILDSYLAELPSDRISIQR